MKTLLILQKALSGIAVIFIITAVLTSLGFINPVASFESSIQDDVEKKLRIKAELGNAESQNKLGAFLYRLAGLQEGGDYSEAIKWLEAASEQQDPIAQMNLGFAYKAGNGVPLDNEKAIKQFYQSGLNFLRLGYPLDAKDNVNNINNLDKTHPLKTSLIDAMKLYKKNEHPPFRSLFD